MRRQILVANLIAAAMAYGGSTAGKTTQIFDSIRNGDAAAVRAQAAKGVDQRNAFGETPLMYAALYGDASTVKLLLARGADVNAKSDGGTTALMLAVGDIEKVKLLVAKGADVNAASSTGRTPLLIAASRANSGEVVRFLLAKGADPKVKDKLQGMPLPTGSGGATPLIEAAKQRDGEAFKALLPVSDIHAKDNAGSDALCVAALHGNVEIVKALIAGGAKVDTKTTPAEFTPLHLAAWRQNPELARLLIEHGADVNARDAFGSTPLMWSAYNDYAEPATTEVLLKAGADLSIRNSNGDTAMRWARARGETAIVALLKAHGAEDVASPAMPEAKYIPASLQKSIAALQAGGPDFVKKSGCVSCHNQSLPQMAASLARKNGIAVDEKIADQTRKAVMSLVKPAYLPLIEMSDVLPDMQATAGYLLLGLNADGYQPDVYTDAGVLNLAAKQLADGSWRPWAPRPPLEFSAITSTAMSARVLDLYAPPARRSEFNARIASAREFLKRETPRTNEEKAMRLLGLKWTGASQSEIEQAAKAVIADQRKDGGWAQLATLSSDAYATGQALYALRIANAVSANDDTYRRGAEYLRKTQYEDGTWRVKSRSFPFQPYKESGFPHGTDQWISSAGTSWATMALLLAK